jgi:hypothetical protein
VTVIKAGYFSVLSSGNTINYLRIDMQVAYTNSAFGTTSFTLPSGGIAVSSPHAQYQFDSADSSLILADRMFNDGDQTTGYLIFQVQGTLDSLNTTQLAIMGGFDTGTQWSFQL